MYTNSTVNSTGCTVASESCAGSRRTCTRLRRVSTTTSRIHSRPGGAPVPATSVSGAERLDEGGGHVGPPRVGVGSEPSGRRRRVRRSGVPGEGEEHVVERGMVDLDVVDRDAGVVERADDRGGQARARRRPAPAAGGRRRRPAPAPATSGARASAAPGSGAASVTSSCSPPTAAFSSPGGAVGDHAAVVDDRDRVGELVGLVEVLRGEQHVVPSATSSRITSHMPLPAGRVEPGGRLVEEQHRRPGR